MRSQPVIDATIFVTKFGGGVPQASFTPFDGGAGVTVATTNTTHSANLLVSGVSAKDKAAQVRKYELVRPSPQATKMLVKPIGTVVSGAGSRPNVLGGD